MWMPILIILAAVSLLVGPIMLMQPTKQQQLQARLRGRAAKLGLRVQLAGKPAGLPQEGAFYCLPWEHVEDAKQLWFLRRMSYAHDLHIAGYWEWRQRDDTVAEALLADVLTTIPEEIFSLNAGPQGLCVYWSERGGEARLDQIEEWLRLQMARLSQTDIGAKRGPGG